MKDGNFDIGKCNSNLGLRSVVSPKCVMNVKMQTKQRKMLNGYLYLEPFFKECLDVQFIILQENKTSDWPESITIIIFEIDIRESFNPYFIVPLNLMTCYGHDFQSKLDVLPSLIFERKVLCVIQMRQRLDLEARFASGEASVSRNEVLGQKFWKQTLIWDRLVLHLATDWSKYRCEECCLVCIFPIVSNKGSLQSVKELVHMKVWRDPWDSL